MAVLLVGARRAVEEEVAAFGAGAPVAGRPPAPFRLERGSYS